MLELAGTYLNGQLILPRLIPSTKPLRVIVTFPDTEENDLPRLQLSDFTFLETQELLKNVKTSFSDEVIAERRSAV